MSTNAKLPLLDSTGHGCSADDRRRLAAPGSLRYRSRGDGESPVSKPGGRRTDSGLDRQGARFTHCRGIRAAFASLLIGTLAAQPGLADATNSHCSSGELVVFSCDTGKKTVSVCASPDLSARGGWVEYRFGPVGAPELVFPAARSHPRHVVQAGTWGFSGGGGAFMQFSKAPYAYTVYTAIGKGWGEKSGVAVLKNGKRIANLPCLGPVQSELGPDLFGRAGLDDQPDAFELP
ncbi:hypothetical protein SAMN05421783_104237 [Thiocapsa roseopersicina]|uniref:Uncharacterized protein n=1 Tax=Thiocapsa roseopersicina TaxID=1058 RepID=A0A1H2TZB0_THIRO|nr:hypothetical protein SAMN05421783_104237 [Thiocapsa roseopersicina]